MAWLAVAAAPAVGACGKEEESGDSAAGGTQNATGTEQKVKGTGGGRCTLEQHAAKKVALQDAVVGCSQSQKQANPFRSAETESIKNEARKVGVQKLLTTNANSQLSKQIADIQDMLAQGARVLMVAPLNAEGLEPAFTAAKKMGVPVITIDRKKISGAPCENRLTFIGSDFVEQGKRAADATIEVTGGNANVAILLGASGNKLGPPAFETAADVMAAQGISDEVIISDQASDEGNAETEVAPAS